MKIESYRAISDIPEHYRVSFQIMAADELFSSYEWYENFSHTVQENGHQFEYLLLLTECEECAAIMPLTLIGRNRIRSQTNYYSPKYKVLVDTHLISEQRALELFVNYICRNLARWHVVDLTPFMENDYQLNSLSELFKSEKKAVFRYATSSNWSQSIQDFDSYYHSRPSKLKNTYKRKLKKLAKEIPSYKIEIISEQEEASEGYQAYNNVYAKSWKKPEPYPDFILGLIKTSALRNWLRLGVLYAEGQPVAIQLWLVNAGTAYIYKLAYVKEYSKYSVGTILTFHLIEHVINNDGVSKLDFLTGDDTFKRDWMEQKSELLGIQVTNPYSLWGLKLTIKNLIADHYRSLKKYILRILAKVNTDSGAT